MEETTLVWLRQDLRIEDQPALFAACKRGRALPVYILQQDEKDHWPLGAASRFWLHHSLKALEKDLSSIGLPLILRKGKVLVILQEIVKETRADALFWNRCYEPFAINLEKRIHEAFRHLPLKIESFNSALLFEPWDVLNKQGKPFQVFAPFWKAYLKSKPRLPFCAPSKQKNVAIKIFSESLDSFSLIPKSHWDSGLKQMWRPGIEGAKARLSVFLEKGIQKYSFDRDRPGIPGGSFLSPHLHFGEISPHVIWNQVIEKCGIDNDLSTVYLRQLGWREFAYHLLYHFPYTPEKPLRGTFAFAKWQKNPQSLKAWKKGLTGYPFVDAGMRELWHTGWMHNRVRMVVGSFLVKDLQISWIEGERYFWDTLVDADLANNALGWQWVAGCGADAAPYFRIFNPCTQGEKFDPEGSYVKKWVPELKNLPSEWIHRPFEAPESVLRDADVVLGKTYPKPIVDHAKARAHALAWFECLKNNRA